MIDKLPDDIIDNILFFFCKRPSDYILIKSLNRTFKNKIEKTKNIFNKNDNYEKDINLFCNHLTPKQTFKWFFDNNINLTLVNIKNLIIYERDDIFNLGFYYSDFLKTLFNRFHINNINTKEFLLESNNPLILAAKYNKIKIIKLLLETSSIGNPYLDNIDQLLDLSIKYNYKNILSY